MRDLDYIESELSRCNKCGYCMQSCPIYRTTRRESQVARARNQTVRAITEGGADITREMLEPFFDCLLCGACTLDCFGRVQTKELMVRAREAFNSEFGDPVVRRYIFRTLLADPKLLTVFVKMAGLGKRTGVSGVARRLGLLRWLSPSLDAAEGLVESMPDRFLRAKLISLGFKEVEEGGVKVMRLDPEQASGPHVAYFIGCATNFQLPGMGEASIRMLSAAGCRITIAPNVCCGLPPYSYGDIEGAHDLARMNVDLFSGLDFDLLVTECGSCSGFLKEWAHLLPDSREAADLSSRTRDMTEVLADLTLPKPRTTGGTVTYHDPCHLGRQQGITEAPRKLLVDVGGFELKEMAESNWCCGGAGSYNLSHPELSKEVLARKMGRIQDTGAEIISTACPACLIQLDFGARTQDTRRPVRHVIELLAERLGLKESA